MHRFHLQHLRCLLFSLVLLLTLAMAESASSLASVDKESVSLPSFKHAYATMLYMGTPRDYEFYVAARVMMQSLRRLKVEADLVVIASEDVPQLWIRSLQREKVNVVSVQNIRNPYRNQPDFDPRFLLTLNKLYAWSLVKYDRVVMLDADNIFLRRADELFQCGQFCAVFINPCIFHTGLFVLEPSEATFNSLVAGLKTRKNEDGADQGYLMAYFEDLLQQPLFLPPADGSKLNGFYRLPLGYQMDASYFCQFYWPTSACGTLAKFFLCLMKVPSDAIVIDIRDPTIFSPDLKLRWNIPCGPHSVITFPSLPWLKPWYWWSWPVLPLGLQWHEQRKATIGYATETPIMMFEVLFYIATIISTMLVRRGLSPQSEKQQVAKLCAGRGLCSENSFISTMLMKSMAVAGIAGAFVLPALLVPRTVHPLMGWSLELLGSISLLLVSMTVGGLPVLPVLTPWLGIMGALIWMAAPVYSNGIARMLAIGAYAFGISPFLWWACKEIWSSIDARWTNFRSEAPPSQLTKMC